MCENAWHTAVRRELRVRLCFGENKSPIDAAILENRNYLAYRLIGYAQPQIGMKSNILCDALQYRSVDYMQHRRLKRQSYRLFSAHFPLL